MLEVCKKDQETLQINLNNVLEELDSVVNLEELFSVDNGICSAIDAGTKAMKKEKGRERLFSLICMLHVPTEKRLTAPLALTKFARENEILRNEIGCCGGWSFPLLWCHAKNHLHWG